MSYNICTLFVTCRESCVKPDTIVDCLLISAISEPINAVFIVITDFFFSHDAENREGLFYFLDSGSAEFGCPNNPM